MVAKIHKQGRIVAQYTYHWPDGKPFYRVNRWNPKSFSQETYTGRQWVSGLSDLAKANPLPFQLPTVLAEIAAGASINLLEGEKDALALAIFGFVTTCNSGGAEKWGAAQSAYLKGATVYIWPDNDAAGAKHVAKAAKCLQAVGCTVYVVTMPDIYNGKPIKDVSDLIEAGVTLAELQSMATHAQRYTAPPEPIETPVNKAEQGRKITDDKRLMAWASAALDGIAADLAKSPAGQHFADMKAAANRLGTIAARGWLTRSECLSALMNACEANGYTTTEGNGRSRQIEKRIRFYFDSGLKHPCDYPNEPEPIKRQKNGDTTELTVISSNQGATFLDCFDWYLPDIWQTWFRRYGRQCHVTAFIWIAAHISGLIEGPAASAEQLATAAEDMSYSSRSEHKTSVATYREGLEKLFAGKILDTYTESVYVSKTFSESEKANHVEYVWKSPETVFSLIMAFADPRIEQDCFPGYKLPDLDLDAQKEKRQPIMANLRPDHFTGQAGKSDDLAFDIANDIKANLPQRDPRSFYAWGKYQKRLNALTVALRSNQTYTPLPSIVNRPKFHTYFEYDRARLLGLIESGEGKVTLSLAELCEFLGVTKQTAINLRNTLNMPVEKNVIDNIPLNPDDNVRAQVYALQRQHKGKIIGMRITDPVTQTDKPVKYSAAKAESLLASQWSVFPIIQTASTTKAPTGDPVKPKSAKKVKRAAPRQTPRFKTWYGDGISCKWLWSQLVLRLIRHGYEDSTVNTLAIDDLIEVARGKHDMKKKAEKPRRIHHSIEADTTPLDFKSPLPICETCGQHTADWHTFDPETKTCKCNDCKRRKAAQFRNEAIA